MNTQIPPREKRISHWFLFLFLLILSLAFYFTTKDFLYPLSTQTLIPELQTFFLSHFGTYTPLIVKIVTLLDSEKAYLLLLLLMYNYGNIYKTYFIYASVTIAQLVMAICKIGILEPRPYWADINEETQKKIIPYDCLGGFGSPSTHVFTSTVFYFVYWKVIFQSKSRKNQTCLKYFSLFVIMIILLLVAFVRLLSGSHSLDQIIFGFLLGICYYVFVFYVKHIYVNNSSQLLKYIKLKKTKYISNIILIIVVYIVVYYIQTNDKERMALGMKYEDKIKKVCPELKDSQILFNESLYLFFIIFSNIGAWFGLKCEYSCMFDKHDQNWKKYNFETDESEIEDRALLASKITITKEIQWNHTGFIKSIFRLIFMCLFLSLCTLPYYYISWDNNIWIVALGKIGLTLNLYTFTMFFLLKQILKWIKLSNLTLFTMLRESI